MSIERSVIEVKEEKGTFPSLLGELDKQPFRESVAIAESDEQGMFVLLFFLFLLSSGFGQAHFSSFSIEDSCRRMFQI